MRPLSPWNYYINNKKKVIPIVISITIGIFLLYFMYIIGNSVISTAEAGYVDSLSHFTLLYPNEETGIDRDIIESITRNENVEKVYRVNTGYTNIKFMGSGTSTMVLFMAEQDYLDMFERMNLKIKEGRMPENKGEILMNWRIAANKGYKVGQDIGSDVNDKEQLKGKYKITGLFDGASQLSFVPVDKNVSEKYHSLMIVPQKGKVRAMNNFIYGLDYKSMDINSLTSIEREFKNNMSIVYIGSTFIELLVILVLCITIGNTTYLHFNQRKREFGILLSVGYKKKDILGKIFSELFYMIIAAFGLGVLLAILAGFILKIVYMDPKGSVINLFDIKYVLVTAILPLFIFMFCIVPSARMIKKTDKVNIIEGL